MFFLQSVGSLEKALQKFTEPEILSQDNAYNCTKSVAITFAHSAVHLIDIFLLDDVCLLFSSTKYQIST